MKKREVEGWKTEVFIYKRIRSREPAFATRFFWDLGAAAEPPRLNPRKELKHAAQSGLVTKIRLQNLTGFKNPLGLE